MARHPPRMLFVDETFRQELVAQVSEQKGENHYRQERREIDEQRAERLAVAGLAKAGWIEEHLAQGQGLSKPRFRWPSPLRSLGGFLCDPEMSVDGWPLLNAWPPG